MKKIKALICILVASCVLFTGCSSVFSGSFDTPNAPTGAKVVPSASFGVNGRADAQDTSGLPHAFHIADENISEFTTFKVIKFLNTEQNPTTFVYAYQGLIKEEKVNEDGTKEQVATSMVTQMLFYNYETRDYRIVFSQTSQPSSVTNAFADIIYDDEGSECGYYIYFEGSYYTFGMEGNIINQVSLAPQIKEAVLNRLEGKSFSSFTIATVAASESSVVLAIDIELTATSGEMDEDQSEEDFEKENNENTLRTFLKVKFHNINLKESGFAWNEKENVIQAFFCGDGDWYLSTLGPFEDLFAWVKGEKRDIYKFKEREAVSTKIYDKDKQNNINHTYYIYGYVDTIKEEVTGEGKEEKVVKRATLVEGSSFMECQMGSNIYLLRSDDAISFYGLGTVIFSETTVNHISQYGNSNEYKIPDLKVKEKTESGEEVEKVVEDKISEIGILNPSPSKWFGISIVTNARVFFRLTRNQTSWTDLSLSLSDIASTKYSLDEIDVKRQDPKDPKKEISMDVTTTNSDIYHPENFLIINESEILISSINNGVMHVKDGKITQVLNASMYQSWYLGDGVFLGLGFENINEMATDLNTMANARVCNFKLTK